MPKKLITAQPAKQSPGVMFNVSGLAERWNIKPTTLNRWRHLGRGPKFIKLGGRVVYRLSDVEQFEDENTAQNTIYVR